MVPVVFLDRDGTINVDDGYVAEPRRWQFIEGALEGLRRLQAAGYRLAVVSNQSGVGRGKYPPADVVRLHQHMLEQLADAGIRLAAVAFCPHAPGDGCACRKPQTGLAAEIRKQLGADYDPQTSWMIGDKISDVQFGAALGLRTALLASRYWESTSRPVPPPTLSAASLLEAAEQILSRPHRACRPGS